MLVKRTMFLAVVQLLGTEHSMNVRSCWETAQQAEQAAVADRAKYMREGLNAAWSVQTGTVYTLPERWPTISLAVVRRKATLDATVLIGHIPVVWASADSMSILLKALLRSSTTASIFCLNREEPLVARMNIPEFLLTLAETLRQPFPKKLQRGVEQWLQTVHTLRDHYMLLTDWWWEWASHVQLRSVTAPKIPGLTYTNGFVVAGDGHAYSVWPTLQEAQDNQRFWTEPYDTPMEVVQSHVYRHSAFPQQALALYATPGGNGTGVHAAICNLELTESDDPKLDDIFRRFQLSNNQRGTSSAEVLLLLIDRLFYADLLHFPRHSPRLTSLPLAVLAQLGYRLPELAQSRLDTWVRAVESAHVTYEHMLQQFKKR